MVDILIIYLIPLTYPLQKFTFALKISTGRGASTEVGNGTFAKDVLRAYFIFTPRICTSRKSLNGFYGKLTLIYSNVSVICGY